MFQLGDIVRVKDGSYAMEYNPVRHVVESASCLALGISEFRVLVVDGHFPTGDRYPENWRNDLMLEDLSRPGFVCFSSSKLVQLRQSAPEPEPKPYVVGVPRDTKNIQITIG